MCLYLRWEKAKRESKNDTNLNTIWVAPNETINKLMKQNGAAYVRVCMRGGGGFHAPV